MNLPIAISTPVELAGTQLLASFDSVGGRIQGALTSAIAAASGTADYTAQEFWSAQGTNGAAVLNVFSTLAKVLGSVYPELMAPEIASAGDNLIVHPDGTVTMKA
jgi:hypothetical protein